MGTDGKWTVAIRPTANQSPRKVTKIIGLKGQGFSVLTPYHKARSGYLFKLPVAPEKRGLYFVPQSEITGFDATDRVKLSYHTDGFAQFSSENPGRIISGRDPKTGEPKGLGLFTHPLDSPIWSGPSVGVTIWGIESFEEAKVQPSTLIFDPDDFYYRDCQPENESGYHLSIYAFPRHVVPPIRYHKGYPTIQVALEPVSGRLVSVVELRVIYLPEEKVYLGLFVNRMKVAFKAESGWTINGPGDFTAEKAGHTLMGIYPRDVIPVEAEHSLDRKP